ncbi:hypothetical protein LCGC14_2556740 [marine sediment metagenome]|uniref:Uncharacterized protein n=1 Tax=marine sediment metagenome TaxID=412755 RepID=A0A0F9AL87_9ZZZZ
MWPIIIIAGVIGGTLYLLDRAKLSRGGAARGGAVLEIVILSGSESSLDGSRVILWRVREIGTDEGLVVMVGELSFDGGRSWRLISDETSTDEDVLRVDLLGAIAAREGFA